MTGASPAGEAYRVAALALQDVEREIESERRRTPSEKHADLRRRGLIALEGKAARMRDALGPLKIAADAEPSRHLSRHGTDIRFKDFEWLPAGTVNLAAFDFIPAIPSILQRVRA
jgi:hypothetical protein